MKASNSWIEDDGNCVWSWFSSVQAGKTESDQRLTRTRRSMKTDHRAPDSGRDISFWFAALSPLLGVLIGYGTLAIFYR
jgi:hypothetical protein